jgi:hypothetical protein
MQIDIVKRRTKNIKNGEAKVFWTKSDIFKKKNERKKAKKKESPFYSFSHSCELIKVLDVAGLKPA